MNKIEELEERCKKLEDRVEALEKALVAVMARPEKTVVAEGGRAPEWVLDGVMYLWYGGQ